jgi:AraC family transcriptional regulator
MALASRVLASGSGWRVQDVVCTSGPDDRPFEERHDGVCIAAVIGGTFRYRSSLGSAVLAPGALLLGNDCHCFECSHEHGVGDRCLSFRLAPEFLETVVSSVPGARRAFFSVPRLPPHDRLLPVIAAAEAARDDGDAGAFEELALRIAGAVSGSLNESKTRPPAPGVRDERRISVVLRYIESRVDGPLSIAELALRCRDESLSLLAHFPRTGGNDAASIHSAHADEARGGFLAANARKRFGDRFHRRFR